MSQKVTPLHGNSTRADSKFSVRKLTMTAMLGAVATVLMYISVSVPLMPSFIKLDLSELPALIASFALGPLSGVAVCLIKNLINLFFSTTGGVGELSNFLLGAIFVFVAGMFYRYMAGRQGRADRSLCGAAAMAVFSVFSNYFVVLSGLHGLHAHGDHPLHVPGHQPNVETLWDALIWFNMPFTFLKGMLSVVITFLIYKKLSPLLKGTKKLAK